MLSIEDKKVLIQQEVQNLDFHIEQLEQAIIASPDSDIEGKIPRSEKLLYLKAKKQVMQEELDNLG